ncbi:DUF3800 domain-containing protein [Ramlibacter albus]|uniref:DUF3800 domain-containing protein n=1 Tax=Ramlibacter albus TaxID=2079448 RepID=UPI001C9B7221
MKSDFIVYVDESGDHSLESIDIHYPLFVLSFCVFRIADYNTLTAPAVRKLKFELFGHDMVVFHEMDIRRKRGAFATFGKEQRDAFMESLALIIAAAPMKIIAVVIDKVRHKQRYSKPAHPYHLAFGFGLERLHRLLRSHGQGDRLTHVICEARGANEDEELELEFRGIRDGDNYRGERLPFELVVTNKRTNSEGLQIADLTARPIGLSVLRPGQPPKAGCTATD